MLVIAEKQPSLLRRAKAFVLLIWGFSLSFSAWAAEPLAPDEGKKRFEAHCGACHSLALPRSQQLDRNTWQWVIDDMVNEFGADWLTQEDQTLILDYLVQAHGPSSLEQ